jgi:hypothetical protein
MEFVNSLPRKPSSAKLVKRSLEIVQNHGIAQALEHKTKLNYTKPSALDIREIKTLPVETEGKRTFQKGLMPSGMADLSAPVTLITSRGMNAIDRHIETSMRPNRGHSRTNSRMPKL